MSSPHQWLSSQQQQQPLILVLDAVSDPGNAGTLLRSAVATGVAAVVWLPDSCDPWNPKAVRAAMGTTFRLPMLHAASWDECAARLLGEGGACRTIYAATMLEDDVNDDVNDNDANRAAPRGGTSLYDVDWTNQDESPIALVIGSEGNGLTPPLRRAVRDGTVQAVHVPMQPGIESLNAAVCGSVILFEYYRQRLMREKGQNNK